jgi:DNA modification methylase
MTETLTNEEKCIPRYAQDNQPTNPALVTPDTSLHSLNLNWTERDLPERERTRHVHRLHPYLGKFIPQLVEVFLRKYFLPGQSVLDPFVGSGTTLVQANELGIHSHGSDISAFNVLLCQAKTARYHMPRATREVIDILGKVRRATQKEAGQALMLPLFETEQVPNCSTSLLCHDRASNRNDYLHAWFAPQALHELLTYRDYIQTEGYEYQDLLNVILSRSARSARLTTHFDLDFPKKPQTEPYWCYKHSRVCHPTTTAFKFIERYSHDTLRRIQVFADRRTSASVTVEHGDSRNVAYPPVDGVITSPPYVGLIDYHEQHAYAYHLLNLDDRREQEIGAAYNGASLKARQHYQQHIAQVFKRVIQAIPVGGRIIVIAADRANLYDEIARMVGVEVEAVVQRHVNRRTGRRSSEFYESVFIWRR